MDRRTFLCRFSTAVAGALALPFVSTTAKVEEIERGNGSIYYRLMKRRGLKTTQQPQVSQQIFQAGKTYRITGHMRSDGKASPIVKCGDKAMWIGTTTKGWQSFDVTFESDNPYDFSLTSKDMSNDGYVEFEDLEVIQVS